MTSARPNINVLHVYKDVYPPVVGGIENHIDMLRKFVTDARSDVLACSRRRRKVTRSTEHGTETLVGEWGRVLSTPLAPGFVRELRRAMPDVIHLHMPNPTGELAFALAQPHTPAVATLHADIDRQAWLQPAYRHLTDRCLGSARYVITSSERIAARSPTLARWREKTKIIPYGVDIARFDPAAVSSERIASVREEFGAPLVVGVGRLVYYKGFEHLIEASRLMSASVVLVGGGPLEHRLRDLATTAPRAHVLGEADETRLMEILAAADCFVLPSVSHAESFGIATLEAQAMGVPAIVTEVGTGTTDAIEDGSTGLVIQPGSARAIADACCTLLDDEDRRERMGAAARERVISRFSAEVMAGRVRELYERAIAEGASGPVATIS